MWIDRFTEFHSGSQATAIKTVSLVDEPLDMYLPGFPVMPCSLVVEGLAQASGILVSEVNDFQRPLVKFFCLFKVAYRAMQGREIIPGCRRVGMNFAERLLTDLQSLAIQFLRFTDIADCLVDCG